MSLKLIEGRKWRTRGGVVSFIQAVIVDRLVESLWFKLVTNQFSSYMILYTAPTRRWLCAKCSPYTAPFIPNNIPDKAIISVTSLRLRKAESGRFWGIPSRSHYSASNYWNWDLELNVASLRFCVFLKPRWLTTLMRPLDSHWAIFLPLPLFLMIWFWSLRRPLLGPRSS